MNEKVHWQRFKLGLCVYQVGRARACGYRILPCNCTGLNFLILTKKKQKDTLLYCVGGQEGEVWGGRHLRRRPKYYMWLSGLFLYASWKSIIKNALISFEMLLILYSCLCDKEFVAIC